jgi:hypothetical protein
MKTLKTEKTLRRPIYKWAEKKLLLTFILTANAFLRSESGNEKQITHITQNNTEIKRNTAHKTTHTIKDTLHRMNTNDHNYNLLTYLCTELRPS